MLPSGPPATPYVKAKSIRLKITLHHMSGGNLISFGWIFECLNQVKERDQGQLQLWYILLTAKSSCAICAH